MRSGPRESIEPACPFCRTSLERPATIVLSAMENALGGACRTCGAIYIADTTGKNVGEVMMQVLGLAAGKLGKEVSDLIPGEDYDDAVLSYDWRRHRSPGVSKGFMDGYGRLYIVKVKQKTA